MQCFYYYLYFNCPLTVLPSSPLPTVVTLSVVSESEFQSLPSYLRQMTLYNLNQAVHNINKFMAECRGQLKDFWTLWGGLVGSDTNSLSGTYEWRINANQLIVAVLAIRTIIGIQIFLSLVYHALYDPIYLINQDIVKISCLSGWKLEDFLKSMIIFLCKPLQTLYINLLLDVRVRTWCLKLRKVLTQQ